MNKIPNSYWMIPKAREVFEDVQRASYYFDTVDYADARTVINVDYDGAVILQRAVAEYLVNHAMEGAGECLKAILSKQDGGRKMTELKKCPFCGSKNVFILKLTTNFYEIRYTGCCEDCNSHGKNTKTEEAAAEAWNRRADT